MEGMNEPIRDEVMNLVHGMMAAGEAQDIENADSFIVMAFDPETAMRFFSGPFEDPVEAMKYADKWINDMNESNEPGDAQCAAAVYPMMNPEQRKDI